MSKIHRMAAGAAMAISAVTLLMIYCSTYRHLSSALVSGRNSILTMRLYSSLAALE
jgi:hypothetical protein